MEYPDPILRTRRPLKIAVLGASNVGKSRIALQFVTNNTIDGTTPTVIEDNYRKEENIAVTDDELIKRILQHINNAEDEDEVLMEEAFGVSVNNEYGKFTPAGINVTMKITDTAGYKYVPKSDLSSSRNILSRLTFRRKQGIYHVSLPERKKGSEVDRSAPSTVKNCEKDENKDRLENCLMQCDGILLVYSVLDDTTFAAACEIRNKLIQLKTSVARNQKGVKNKQHTNIFVKLGLTCCRQKNEIGVKVPPVFLVGTHADVRVEKMLHEKSSRIYDINFLHKSEGTRKDRTANRKRRVGKTLTAGRSSIHPHDVYPIISDWKECSGFAEITSTDATLIKQIFEKLTLAIIAPP